MEGGSAGLKKGCCDEWRVSLLSLSPLISMQSLCLQRGHKAPDLSLSCERSEGKFKKGRVGEGVAG